MTSAGFAATGAGGHLIGIGGTGRGASKRENTLGIRLQQFERLPPSDVRVGSSKEVSEVPPIGVARIRLDDLPNRRQRLSILKLEARIVADLQLVRDDAFAFLLFLLLCRLATGDLDL